MPRLAALVQAKKGPVDTPFRVEGPSGVVSAGRGSGLRFGAAADRSAVSFTPSFQAPQVDVPVVVNCDAERLVR